METSTPASVRKPGLVGTLGLAIALVGLSLQLSGTQDDTLAPFLLWAAGAVVVGAAIWAAALRLWPRARARYVTWVSTEVSNEIGRRLTDVLEGKKSAPPGEDEQHLKAKTDRLEKTVKAMEKRLKNAEAAGTASEQSAYERKEARRGLTRAAITKIAGELDYIEHTVANNASNYFTRGRGSRTMSS